MHDEQHRSGEPETQQDNRIWGSTISSLMKIIEKNKHQLAYFENRLKQAEYLDRPNMRLVGAASGHVLSLKDQITALELELQELQRLEGGGLVLSLMEERDLRWIWWWFNEPSVRPLLKREYPSFEGFTDQWQSWLNDETLHPLSIRLATDELIGCLMMRDNKDTTMLDMLMLCPDYRFRGYGPDAVREAIRVAFDQADDGQDADTLFTVRVDVEHAVAVRCFEKAGLRSLIREADADIGEETPSGYIMGISREDWLRENAGESEGSSVVVWTSGKPEGNSLVIEGIEKTQGEHGEG